MTNSLSAQSSSSLDINDGESATFVFTIKPTSQPAANEERFVFSHVFKDTKKAFEFFYQNTAGTNQLVFRRRVPGGNATDLTYNTTLPTNAFTNIIATFSSSTFDGEMYINGVLTTSGSMSYPSGGSNLPFGSFILGAIYKDWGANPPYIVHKWWKGYMDEFIALKEHWTQAEVTSYYDNYFKSGTATELSGTINASTTWSFVDSPYVVTSTVTVNAGVTVTVEPGVVIKFKDDKDLIINGTLDVRGTTSNSSTMVYFTSYHDDAVGGDTNGNGSATVPAAGKWGGIVTGSGASTTLAGSVVRYGGNDTSGNNASSTVYNTGGTLNLRYADISYAGRDGLRTDSGTTTVQYSAIHNNVTTAIRVIAGTITMASSSIYNNNLDVGVVQSGVPTSTMTNNFWGGWFPLDDISITTNNSGPNHTTTNLEGAGDQVSDYVNYNQYISAYLSHPDVPTWSPPGINSSTFKMRVGSSTQYYSSVLGGINTWNTSASGYIEIVDASSSPPRDIYLVDINAGTTTWAGIWTPSTTSTPHIVFNIDGMETGDSSAKQCVATHELGHALGLAHSTTGNIMKKGCPSSSAQTTLGTQDVSDFNLLWSPTYFFDPHRWKGIIKW